MWLTVIVLIGFSTCEYILGDKENNKKKKNPTEIINNIFLTFDLDFFLNFPS